MHVHHINCGSLCPVGGRLINGDGAVTTRARMVCHCLLIETDDGLVLVDTGMGLADMADPARRLGRAFALVGQPRCDPSEAAVRRVAALGFSPDDVRHIVVTHLDLDHAGGIPDFPRARVHIHAPEHRAAMHPTTLRERHRYCAAHWAHGPDWNVVGAADGERWFGFDAVRALPGAGREEVLLVPLGGHSRGHCGVAVRTGAERWLLHAGDAYFFHAEADPARPRCTPGLAAFQRAVALDDVARRANQARLRELVRAHAGEVEVFCAHDPLEFDRCARAADADDAPATTAAGGAAATHGRETAV